MIGSLVFLILGNAVCYMTLRYTLVEAVITDTTIGWDIAGSPDVYVKMTVGSRTNTWGVKDNTFHPTWNTSFTWTDVTDTDIERVFFQFFDEDTFFDEAIGDIYLDFTDYKSPSDNPKEFFMSSTFDYVTFYGRVLLTYPAGDECGGKTCATCSSSNACSSVAMNGQCWWHSSACYNRSNLCNGVTCETCKTSEACASDPDITGQCSWNSSANTCYNLSSQGKGNEPITYTDNGVTKTGYIVLDEQYRTSSTANYKLSDAGVTVNGNSVTQKFVTGGNVGSRLYLLDAAQKSYVKFKLSDAELSYDVEISQIPCGMNAAIYTVEMPADGVTPGHTSGAASGGGYCDSNSIGGVGCAEFDIGESNAHATVYTSHGCSPTTGFAPKGSITCDTQGAAANPFHADKAFYGTGASFTINTAQKFTVVTQFRKSAATTLASIDRLYVQNGTRVKQPNNIVSGLEQISQSLAVGHVLVFSLWASDGDMAWLDANDNGPCQSANESSAYLQKNYPGASVTYSNIRYGPIDSTY